MSKGLLMVHTGNGKGKTTAALGLAFRALGQGLQVCVIQFIKGSGKYGEMTAAERFSDLLEFHVMGRGFTVITSYSIHYTKLYEAAVVLPFPLPV